MNKGFGEIEADLVVLQGFVHKPISLSLSLALVIKRRIMVCQFPWTTKVLFSTFGTFLGCPQSSPRQVKGLAVREGEKGRVTKGHPKVAGHEHPHLQCNIVEPL